jgi:hypothetical protein
MPAPREFSGDRESGREVSSNITAEKYYVERRALPLLSDHDGIGSTACTGPPLNVLATEGMPPGLAARSPLEVMTAAAGHTVRVLPFAATSICR